MPWAVSISRFLLMGMGWDHRRGEVLVGSSHRLNRDGYRNNILGRGRILRIYGILC